jgi:hypothetical protein
MWLCVALFALGGAFFAGLKIGSKMVVHYPVPTQPSTIGY